MIIRPIKIEDAQEYMKLYQSLDQETLFRLYESGERGENLQEYEEEIFRFTQGKQGIILVAQEKESKKLIGYIQGITRKPKRIAHVISINIAILQAYTGKGIGKKLFEELEKWAKENQKYRLDLSVMENNPNAYKLYQRLGFKEEGIKEKSMKFGSEYINEIYMSKWIGE